MKIILAPRPASPTCGLILPALLLLLLIPGCDGCSSNVISSCSQTCATDTYCCSKTRQCEPVKHNCTNTQSCQPGFELNFGPGPFMNESTCEALPLECTCVESASFQPGIVGRFSALTVSNGVLLASAFESTFGDLVLVSAKVTALDKLSLEIVDGVPAVPPVKDPKSWRGGVEDAGDEVGQDTDIVVSAAGDPMISYLDKTNRSLKFALKTSDSWTSYTLDTAIGEEEIVGRYSAMVMIDGKPNITYLAINIPSAELPGAFHADLRWASATSSTPKTKTDWAISTIESSTMPCRNLCSSSQACIANGDDSSSCKDKDTSCASCSNTEVCIAGACVTPIANVGFEDLPLAIGLWPCPVATAGGPAVFYYDNLQGVLRGATQSQGQWKPGVVQEVAGQKVGAFCSAVPEGAKVHLVYQNLSRLSLHYTQVDPSTLAASPTEVVDDGLRPDGPHPVGADSALVIDGNGALSVIYQDAQTADLLAAKRTGADTWTPSDTVDANRGRLPKGGPRGYGFYSDLAQEGSVVYGSTFFYDPNNSPKVGLEFFTVK
jgi:hypothetical protein